MFRRFCWLICAVVGVSAGVAWGAETSGDAFVSEWRVMDGALEIALPLPYGYNYDFTIDWGDGNTGHVDAFNDPDTRHLYATAGHLQRSLSKAHWRLGVFFATQRARTG